ncbi:hypothetical protein R1flu_006476 [Riccia fluitans]|uniref:arginine decarboxylase n=1 Tax=Riccia fluitans TaxID=41844 RepID=A0ABD1YW39_9MARC
MAAGAVSLGQLRVHSSSSPFFSGGSGRYEFKSRLSERRRPRRTAVTVRSEDYSATSSTSSSSESKSTARPSNMGDGKSSTSRKQPEHLEPFPAHFEMKHADNREEAMQLNMVELTHGGYGLLYGSRIPKHFFNVHGFGETDRGDGADPWETGSYDLALEDAGIQDLNITQYSSVIAPESTKITNEEAQAFFRHGAVMEAIMSTMHGVKGDRITAGVGRMQIRRKSDGTTIGGYAAEYEGHAMTKKAEEILRGDLQGIFCRRFDPDEYECFDEEFTIRTGEVERAFGTVIAAICFTSYVFPVYPRVS